MLCVILRVWEKWAAVVDSKVICVSSRKDRAIALWKAGDARMARAPIGKFVFLTFLDRRFEVIEAEQLVGRGQTYRAAMRSGAKLSEADKDSIASAIALVRSAEWSQLPPKFQAYEDANRAWSKARDSYREAASEFVKAKAAAKAAAVVVAKSSREGGIAKTMAAKTRAEKLADKARQLMHRATRAQNLDLMATAAMKEATDAHLASKPWETRELVAYRALGAAANARAARRRSLARGKPLDSKAEAQFAQLVEEAETLMQRLREEDDASRGNGSLGPVWRLFSI
ncbi:MAG: hypothetical protein ABI702_19360 [Burkholderiales bacterium]